jgi:hypothetical protein
LRSGTSGFSITAARGSGRGTSGTETRPPPRRLRADAPELVPELRTETDRDEVLLPESERDSRPETERRDVDEREEAREERELLRAELLLRPPPVIPVGGEETIPLGVTTGARPQVPQYTSPPPMSS